jgi:hypothetical protein
MTYLLKSFRDESPVLAYNVQISVAFTFKPEMMSLVPAGLFFKTGETSSSSS